MTEAPLGTSIGSVEAAPQDTRRVGRSGRQVQSTSQRQNLLLLVQLRWIAVAGQVITIDLVQWGFGIALPWIEMAGVMIVLAPINLFAMLRYRSGAAISNAELFVELLLDVGALTGLLYLSGGAINPFVSLYLLQVILGAVLFEVMWSWVLVAVTSGCYLMLMVWHREIALPEPFGASFSGVFILGGFISFLLAAILAVAFISRITINLRRRDERLADLRQQSAEEDHIVRMGLLASGAAHELGTPLATLSVILNDWQRMPALSGDGELRQDIAEMQAQLARCKTIVSGILLSAGEARGEGTEHSSVNAFLDGVVEEWRGSRPGVRLDYRNDFGEDEEIISDAALRQVIFNVFDNAFEESPRWVAVTATRREDDLILRTEDAGRGFDAAILAELGKPYRSTKNRPGGGLGLFLVFNVIRKLGGRVEAGNRPEGGAFVELVLPLSSLSPDPEPEGEVPAMGRQAADERTS
jgi:two-component system sensor histidine kinase RegB